MPNTKRLFSAIITFMFLFSIPGTVFAKAWFPEDIENLLSDVEVASQQEIIEVRTLITEVAGDNPEFVQKEVSALITDSKLRPVVSEIPKNDVIVAVNDENLDKKIQKTKEKKKIIHIKVDNEPVLKVIIPKKQQDKEIEVKVPKKVIKQVDLSVEEPVTTVQIEEKLEKTVKEAKKAIKQAEKAAEKAEKETKKVVLEAVKNAEKEAAKAEKKAELAEKKSEKTSKSQSSNKSKKSKSKSKK